MSEADRAELATLRERAYGPDADIDADPIAQARLQQLEADLQGIGGGADPGGEPPGGGPASIEDDPPAAEHDDSDPAAEPAPHPQVAPPPAAGRTLLRRSMPALWALSLIIAAAVAVGMSLSWAAVVFAPISRGSDGISQVAVLTPDAAFEAGEEGFFWMGAARGFTVFEGLLPIAVDGEQMGAEGSECLALMRMADYTPGADTIEGPVYWSCDAGAFPATVQFVVDFQAPQQLRERFADGTALQFVLDGDRIGVFSDE